MSDTWLYLVRSANVANVVLTSSINSLMAVVAAVVSRVGGATQGQCRTTRTDGDLGILTLLDDVHRPQRADGAGSGEDIGSTGAVCREQELVVGAVDRDNGRGNTSVETVD